MSSFVHRLRKAWNNWVGDRDMEMAIRRHLSKNGYFGNTAKITGVKLIAVQRPGWIQVFRFEVQARIQIEETDGPDPEAKYENLFGLIREDHRKSSTKIRVFHRHDQRVELYRRWSEDLIQLRGGL